MQKEFKSVLGRMDVREFGQDLITSQDLDPVYSLIAGNKLLGGEDNPSLEGDALRHRFYLAYWCFYDIGAASFIADEGSLDEFWSRMHTAAKNEKLSPLGERWPRAAERRHFRGRKAIEGVQGLRQILEGDPANLLPFLFQGKRGKIPFQALRKQVMTLPQFGPWMAFKVGDMLERIDRLPIDFSNSDVFMFEDPAQGALLVWEHLYYKEPEYRSEGKQRITRRVVADLKRYFNKDKKLSAPPAYDREINIQEIETVLCKWKSHLRGNYPIGKDTEHSRKSITAWAPYSNVGQGFLKPLDILTGEYA